MTLDNGNPSHSLVCHKCSTLLPQHATFCSFCGEPIQKNEAGDARTEKGDHAAQEQETDDTLRLSPLSLAHLKGLQSYRSVRNNGIIATTLIRNQVPQLSVKSNNNSAGTGPLSKTWGWLPILSVISAVGVFLIAIAYEGGRISAQWPEPLFWFGLLVLFLPVALRLLSAEPTRQERIALLVVLVINLYLVKFLQYPLHFAFYDEFLQWRTTLDIVASGHLFHENPLLPISAFYPGLEIVTSTLSSLTGLSPFASGIVLIGVVHLVFVLALYLFFELFTNSARAAAIATVLYMANPGFLFFDMDISYESLALPLAVFVLFAVARRSYTPASGRRGLTLAIWLGLGAVVITHHVTSYALVAFLFFWTTVFLLLRMVASFHQNRSQKDQPGPSPGAVALLGLVLSVAWLMYTGNIAVGYLVPHVDNTVQQVMQILAHKRAPRQLFHNPSGFVVPLWQRVSTYTSVALILLGLPFGFFQIWKRHRANAATLTLVAAALAYPVSQALRLTPAGGETGDRATEFVFLGIAFVLAIGVTEFWFSRMASWRRSAMVMGAVVLLCFGQMVLGSGQPWTLLPGPYLVSADARSIEPEGITAAEWAGLYLRPGHRIASDRINTLLMATYGDEEVVTGWNGNIPVAPVFTALHLGPAVIATLQQDRIQYLVVDRRLSTSLPYVGTYFSQTAAGAVPTTRPIDMAALAKFDGVQNVSRIFDSGNLSIYDVEAIANRPSTTPTPQVLCTPVPSTAASSSYPNVAKHYTGTIYDISTSMAINISLTGIQQQQEAFCGSFSEMPMNTHFTEIPSNGPFKGTITTGGQIQFILTSGTEKVTFSFDGVILSDGGMAGTYCSPRGGTGKCSDYGLWSVSPARSG